MQEGSMIEPRTAADELRLPWHRETVGHLSTAGIAAKNAADLDVRLAEGLPPNTDATWIVNADNKIVAFVGNGPRQTANADAIIAAVEAAAAAKAEPLDVERACAHCTDPQAHIAAALAQPERQEDE